MCIRDRSGVQELFHSCEIILEHRTGSEDPEYLENGNVLLDRLFGASIKTVPAGTDMDAALEESAEEIQKNGGIPYIIPGGGSNPTGALGYVNCATELVGQLNDRGLKADHLVTATGSASTRPGLSQGWKEQEAEYRCWAYAWVLKKKLRKKRFLILSKEQPNS